MSVDAGSARFVAAHRALVDDGVIQLGLPAQVPQHYPRWLIALGHWLDRMLAAAGKPFGWLGRLLPNAPYARILLWAVLAAAAVGFGWMIYERLRHGVWHWPRWRRRRAVAVVDAAAEPDWAPEIAPARALLREADALAGEGRFAEAIHLLLWRSLEDIRRRRPRLLRPSLTSRDIAAAAELPDAARTTFAAIARVVERSLFGGVPVGADDWAACRGSYADFALPGAWR